MALSFTNVSMDDQLMFQEMLLNVDEEADLLSLPMEEEEERFFPESNIGRLPQQQQHSFYFPNTLQQDFFPPPPPSHQQQPHFAPVVHSTNNMMMQQSLGGNPVSSGVASVSSTATTSSSSSSASSNSFYPIKSEFSSKTKSVEDDGEELCKKPIKSLTEEERKTRRRAQIAKSARKHRNRQKEELTRLRNQVQELQKQMEVLRSQAKSSANENSRNKGAGAEIFEEEALTLRRKRQRNTADNDSGMYSTEMASYSTVPNNSDGTFNEDISCSATSALHSYTCIDDTDNASRMETLNRIADRRLLHAEALVRRETRTKSDAKSFKEVHLSGSGPDIEIKLVRATIFNDVTVHQVMGAIWHTVLNFSTYEKRIDHVDREQIFSTDQIRYGRLTIPMRKISDDDCTFHLDSLYLAKKKIISDSLAVLSWDTIDEDARYPSTNSNYIRNEEVGSVVLESRHLENGRLQTVLKAVVYASPPVKAISKPMGVISEAFLTTFCRCAAFFDSAVSRGLTDGDVEHDKIQVSTGVISTESSSLAITKETTEGILEKVIKNEGHLNEY